MLDLRSVTNHRNPVLRPSTVVTHWPLPGKEVERSYSENEGYGDVTK